VTNKISIHEIARRSNVSIATVSRVLNNKGPVKQETRDQIVRIARELNYKPNSTARSLSRRKTDSIGVILPELVDEFFMNIIQGIDEEAHRYNRYLMISSSHSQRNDIETILEFMSSGRVDGVILMAPSFNDEIFEIIQKSHCPVVLLNPGTTRKDIIGFSIDNYNGARTIVSHLIGHGYEKIGIIRGPVHNIDAQQRFKGYFDALTEGGLKYSEMQDVSGDFSLKSGYYAFTRLMSQSDRPRAIFACNDYMALGAYQAARNMNIRIPEDVALAGFDDVFSSGIVNPRLTTIHIPIIELSRRALSYLVKMIDGDVDSAEPYQETVSTGLVIGSSCGCKQSMSQY